MTKKQPTYAKITQPSPDLTFEISPKTLSNGVKYEIIDSLGYHCGYFDSEAQAKTAVPKIAANLRHGNCKPLKHKPPQRKR